MITEAKTPKKKEDHQFYYYYQDVDEIWVTYLDCNLDMGSDVHDITPYVPITENSRNAMCMVFCLSTDEIILVDTLLSKWEKYIIPTENICDDGFWLSKEGIY